MPTATNVPFVRKHLHMPLPPRAPLAPLRLPQADLLVADVIQGLSGYPKHLPSKWLYDATGSVLFEQITNGPEYYINQAERSVLTPSASSIADLSGAQTLIDLGAGSHHHPELLINALEKTLQSYVPVDISRHALSQTTARITPGYPAVSVTPVLADFTTTLDHPPVQGPRLVAMLGGSLGNLLPHERARSVPIGSGRGPPAAARSRSTSGPGPSRSIMSSRWAKAGTRAADSSWEVEVLPSPPRRWCPAAKFVSVMRRTASRSGRVVRGGWAGGIPVAVTRALTAWSGRPAAR
ncbi:L-histidine N(alpha)-methyltransferase [Streptomyces sp. MMS24-I2-30]|uniref:L-histidine N(alpha)-methyltransferase n=1 Tax=Streptomyces sp. MMS24-I2-30 TaxID=3351564 RepID=UPI003896CEE9